MLRKPEMDEKVLQWFRDLTVARRDFSIPDLASAEAPFRVLHNIQAGNRPLTAAKFLAVLRVALHQDPEAAVAALGRFLALASPRLVTHLAPCPLAIADLERETAEAVVAVAGVQAWELEAGADGMFTPEEKADGRGRVQRAMRELAETGAALDGQPTQQLSLAGGMR